MRQPAAFAVQDARRIALGTVQFGLPYGIANQAGQVPAAEARRIVRLAKDAGVDTIDTAIGYCESENVLGDIGVGAFNVVTKLPKLPAGVSDIPQWVNTEVDAALSRLRVAQLYGLLLHHPMDLLGPHGATLFRSLRALKERSVVQKIGVSIYAPEELAALTERYRFDLIQGPLNLLDRRLHASGWLRRLKEDGAEIHTRSAFLQGLLLMSRARIPAKFARWGALWDRWDQWSASDRAAALRACLAFPLSLAEVDRVVIGADSVQQFEQVLSSATAVPAALPDIACDDERLINPANWTNL